MKISIRDNLFKFAGKEERKRATGLNFDFAEKKIKETESEPSRDLIQKFIAEQSQELPFKPEIIDRINSLNIERERARYNKEEAFYVIAGSVMTTDSLDAAKTKLENIEEYMVRLELTAGNLSTNFFSGIDLNKSEDILKIVEAYKKFYSEVEEEKRRVEDEKKNASSSGYKSNEVVHDFGDGWKVVYVPAAGEMESFSGNPKTSHDRILEGNKNGLCLGSSTKFYQDNDQGKIYSVRNPENEPEVTIRIRENNLEEAKGKNNNPPSVEGAAHANEWFNLHGDTLDYKNSYDYKSFPPYSIESAKSLWEGESKSQFYTKGWVVSWYKNGLSELDEYTRKLIEEKNPLIIYSGLGKKYKELVEPVVEHFALKFLENNKDDTLFGHMGHDRSLYRFSHESWKTYRKNPLMVQAVQQLANINKEHFLMLGMFKINEYYDIAKNIIKKCKLKTLSYYKVIEDEKWKEECLEALTSEINILMDVRAVSGFFELYDSLVNKNADYLLDHLFKNDDILLNNLNEEKAKQIARNIYSRKENSRLKSLFYKVIDLVSINFICGLLYDGYEERPLYNDEIAEKISKEILSMNIKDIPNLISMHCINKDAMKPLKNWIIEKISLMNDEEINEVFNLKYIKEIDDRIIVDNRDIFSVSNLIVKFIDDNAFIINNLDLINKVGSKVLASPKNFIEDLTKITVNNVNKNIAHKHIDILGLPPEEVANHGTLVNDDRTDVATLSLSLDTIFRNNSYLFDHFLDFFDQSSAEIRTLILHILFMDNIVGAIKIVKMYLSKGINQKDIEFFSNYAKLNPHLFFERIESSHLKFLFKNRAFIEAYEDYICLIISKKADGLLYRIDTLIDKILIEDNDYKKSSASKIFSCFIEYNEYFVGKIREFAAKTADYLPKELLFKYIDILLSEIHIHSEVIEFLGFLTDKAIYDELYSYFINGLISKLYSDIEEHNNFDAINKAFSYADILNDVIDIFSETKDKRIERIFDRISKDSKASFLLLSHSRHLANSDLIKKYISDAAKNSAEGTIGRSHAIEILSEYHIRNLDEEFIDSDLKKIIFNFFKDNIKSKSSFHIISEYLDMNILILLKDKYLESFNLILNELGGDYILNIFIQNIKENLPWNCSSTETFSYHKKRYLSNMRSLFDSLQSRNLVPSKENFKNNLSNILIEDRNNEALKYCVNEVILYLVNGLYGSEEKTASNKILNLSRSLKDLGLTKEALRTINLI